MENDIMQSRKKVVVDNPGKGGLIKILKIALITGVVLSIIGFAALCTLVYYLKQDLPSTADVTNYKPIIGTSVYAHDGTRIADFAIEKRLVLPYDRIPAKMVLAFVAAEDQNFFSHFGIDPVGILRAAVKNFKAGGIKEGASTITMQVARTFFLSREKKFIRKLNEIILAVFELEPNLTKEEIMWLYLNQIYLGHGAYGVQQAAKTYFDKDVWELKVDEMAVIAGMPKAPGRDSPFINMEKAIGRKNYVLGRMLSEGYVSQEEYDAAIARPITLKHSPELFFEYAPHYAEHVRKYIYDKYGETALYKGGMRVDTALDMQAQYYAQEALYYGLRNLDHRQGYRGPLANIPEGKYEEMIKNLEKKYAKKGLERDYLYIGLVTDVSDKKKRTEVQVGRWKAYIPFDTMKWARKPREDVRWEHDLIKRPSQALKKGDVIYVRPSDPVGIKERFDFRHSYAIDPSSMIWILEQTPKAQSAILSKEPDSGYVVAMVGGYNFEESEFNRAFQACRQPGSAFKPIVYSAAIEKGWNVSTTILDSPIVDGEWKWKWKPENYGAKFKGEVSLRYALQNSLNIPAIKTLDYVGIERSKEMAIRMGVKTNIQEDRSISLGSACATVNDMVNVYAHFANKGKKPRTVYVTRVIDRDGNVLEDNRNYYDITLDPREKLDRLEQEALSNDEQILSENDAFIMAWLLTQVVKGGTGVGALPLNRPCGGKTGTTNDNYDAWFIGFTPDIVTGVWIGHDDNSRTLGKVETGGKAALPIWLDYMKRTLDGKEVLDFEAPPAISWMMVNKVNGKKAVEGAMQTIKAPFRPGEKPAETMIIEGEQDPDELYKMTDLY